MSGGMRDNFFTSLSKLLLALSQGAPTKLSKEPSPPEPGLVTSEFCVWQQPLLMNSHTSKHDLD